MTSPGRVLKTAKPMRPVSGVRHAHTPTSETVSARRPTAGTPTDHPSGPPFGRRPPQPGRRPRAIEPSDATTGPVPWALRPGARHEGPVPRLHHRPGPPGPGLHRAPPPRIRLPVLLVHDQDVAPAKAGQRIHCEGTVHRERTRQLP